MLIMSLAEERKHVRYRLLHHVTIDDEQQELLLRIRLKTLVCPETVV